MKKRHIDLADDRRKQEFDDSLVRAKLALSSARFAFEALVKAIKEAEHSE